MFKTLSPRAVRWRHHRMLSMRLEIWHATVRHGFTLLANLSTISRKKGGSILPWETYDAPIEIKTNMEEHTFECQIGILKYSYGPI